MNQGTRPVNASPAMQVIDISSDSDEHASDDGMRMVKSADAQRLKIIPHEVIELTDSDSSPELPDQLSPMVQRARCSGKTSRGTRKHISLYADTSDEDDRESDDGAIITINDPPRSRMPIRISSPTKGVKRQFFYDTPVSGLVGTSGFISVEGILPVQPPSPIKKRPVARGSADKPTSTPSRLSKKARGIDEQAQKEKYAADLFVQLNSTVFDDLLPKETELEWNKRLLTTAGRARWHRLRDGVDSTKVELSVKILDCNERIRNTLAHEMCHLACWVINNKPQEGHGQLFKTWGSKVMRMYPDIQVSTRHNYEISYPYKWKCERCSKVYGRYSKSIRPEACVCGVCKIGKLVPQFSEKTTVPKMTTGASQSTVAETRPHTLPSRPVECGDTFFDVDQLAGIFKDVHVK